MNEQTQLDIKTKITQLRQSYARLKIACGPNHISQATIKQYTQAIQQLEQQLKGGDEK